MIVARQLIFDLLNPLRRRRSFQSPFSQPSQKRCPLLRSLFHKGIQEIKEDRLDLFPKELDPQHNSHKCGVLFETSGVLKLDRPIGYVYVFEVG